jgi:hypothetical protein
MTILTPRSQRITNKHCIHDLSHTTGATLSYSASKANLLHATHKGALGSCTVASPQSNILETVKTNHPSKKQHNSASPVIEYFSNEGHPRMNCRCS